MKIQLTKSEEKKVLKEIDKGFNHTYEIKIKINNIPQPSMQLFRQLACALEELGEIMGAKVKWSEQND